MKKHIILNLLLLFALTISAVSASCGIFTWDPYNLCPHEYNITKYPSLRMLSVVNGVFDNYMYSKAYADITPAAIELKRMGFTDEFNMVIKETHSDNAHLLDLVSKSAYKRWNSSLSDADLHLLILEDAHTASFTSAYKL